ncbi:hypothetical protein HFO60_24325 [Rhizobium leguminosarum]|uniref:hypothetical protein n=1 Tax=Rhizobium leguminosarum TaxID=384 RepID=UPI001C989F67|nr:hypothetical protein [Rhizobium leguminosarum]MBY5543104.1 hypothetical protein [Rhizobium leguminosarum]
MNNLLKKLAGANLSRILLRGDVIAFLLILWVFVVPVAYIIASNTQAVTNFLSELNSSPNPLRTAKFFSIPLVWVINFIAIILITIFWYSLKTASRGRDIDDREVSSKIEQSERRIYEDVRRQLLQRAEKELVGTELVTQALERKLQDGILVTLDKALKTRLDAAASKVHALNHIDETLGRIRIKLDGPSSRAENAAAISRIFAYAFAMLGVTLAIYRVTSLEAAQTFGINYDWPNVMMKAGPWVGLVLLIEFTALLFLRFYNRSIELQRYFTRELAGIESQFLGLKVAIDIGGRTDGVKASAALLKIEPNSFVEDREEELSTLNKAIEGVADLVKKLKPVADAGVSKASE